MFMRVFVIEVCMYVGCSCINVYIYICILMCLSIYTYMYSHIYLYIYIYILGYIRLTHGVTIYVCVCVIISYLSLFDVVVYCFFSSMFTTTSNKLKYDMSTHTHT